MEQEIATQQDTIEELLKRSKRPGGVAPLRWSFAQQGQRGNPQPGPLADLLHRHDKGALDLYLLLLAVASAPPFDVTRPAAVWARALKLSEPAAVSKILRRLDERHLIRRVRKRGLASVTVLCEDGSGEEYSHPGQVGAREGYAKLPFAYWLNGWQGRLTLPGKAMLLVGLTLEADFWLPYEKADEWYGISSDSAQAGIEDLEQHQLLKRRWTPKKAPLSATGTTTEMRCTLQPPFFHTRVRRSGASGAP